MKDIKQQIEEAYNYHSELARDEIDSFEYEGTITTDEAESCVRTAEIEGFKEGFSLALSLFRWRKVEELPEESEDINAYVNTCLYAMRMVCINGINTWFVNGTSIIFHTADIDRWRPIEI